MATAVEVKILVKGKPLPSFISLSVQQDIFEHHTFDVVCRPDTFDTFSSTGDSFVIEKAKDLIGKKIKIEICAIGKDNLKSKSVVVFNGIILEVEGSKFQDAMSGSILIRGASMDAVLKGDRHCRSFENMTLDDIVQQVVNEYSSNLFDKTEVNSDNKNKLEYVVQYNETNHDFLVRLAKTYGEWFLVNGVNAFHFGEPPSAKVNLLHGKDLHEFSFSMKLVNTGFNYTAYNYYEEESIKKDSGSIQPKLDGYLHDAASGSEDVYAQEENIYHNIPLSKANAEKELEAKVKADKQSRVADFNLIKGASDNCEVSLGGTVKIEGITGAAGKTLGFGEYRIISLFHSCDDAGNYLNQFEGVPISIETPPYCNTALHPVCETQSAVVTDTDDPEGIGRVRVKFFWQDNGQSPWIRVVTPYSGNNKGFFFIPEIGEEVLVGFENSDADKPFVMGTHYNGKKKPTDWKNSNNYKKAIRTQSGHTIEFNDEGGNEEIIIYDKGKVNTITLSSHDKKLTISCLGDLKIEAENIEITARKDYKLDVKGKIDIASMNDTEIKATGNVKIHSNQDVTIEAVSNLKAKATMSAEISGMTLAAKGSTTAEFSAGMQTTVKGAIVQIN